MYPIHIICHTDCDPHGYLCDYLDNRGVAYQKARVAENELAAIDMDAIGGLIFMGGPHSVNDNHPWLEQELRFVERAMAKDIPMMGVCFGAQLISKVLGAEVTAADKMETGWHRIETDTTRLDSDQAGNLDACFEAFEWHEDTFTIPTGAIPVFKGAGIENQGYVHGRVLAMQFHLEMTEHMVFDWLARYRDCLPAPSATVQSPAQITDRLSERLARLHAVADRVYDWWLGQQVSPG